jgi:hypothetical protein
MRIGGFEVIPCLQVRPEGVSRELLREIALTALKQATLSWMPPPPKTMQRVPTPPIRRNSQGL